MPDEQVLEDMKLAIDCLGEKKRIAANQRRFDPAALELLR